MPDAVFIVCDGPRCVNKENVIGCIKRRCETDCTICEIKYRKQFESCPFTGYGGKKRQELDGNKCINRHCYYCKTFGGIPAKAVH